VLNVFLVWLMHALIWYSFALALAIFRNHGRALTLGHALGVGIFSGGAHLLVCYFHQLGVCA